MKNSQIIITKKQANIAFGLCIDNITSFIQDIEIMLKESKFDHIIIPIQFAMEELGKAKILVDKINNSLSDKITLTKNDGWLDHEKKVEIASELIDLPRYQKELIDSLMRCSPMDIFSGFPPGFLADAVVYGELEELQDKAKQGHSLRLESSFVGFDKNTGEPMIGKGLPIEEVVTFLQVLKDGLMKIEKNYIWKDKTS